MIIKTPQTTQEGQRVSCVLIEEATLIKQELYIGLLIDRDSQKICLIASKEGGVEIEEVAHNNPDSIKRIAIEKSRGLMPFQVREFAGVTAGAFHQSIKKQLLKLLQGLYKAFIECDAAMIEINPLVITGDDCLVALDAKMTIDENALYRQQQIDEMRDPTQEDEKEIEAQRHGLAYVALDGNIGCMVNGAGLAMATMDVIKHVGGSPANFLDVGGSATTQRVEQALKIIAQDKKVKAIFVNVFGGIAKCDGNPPMALLTLRVSKLELSLIGYACRAQTLSSVKNRLNKSGLRIIAAADMLAGAKQAVKRREFNNGHICQQPYQSNGSRYHW